MECKVALAKAGPAAVPVLLDALKTGSPASRRLAYEALGFMANEKFRPAIEKLRPGLLQAVEDKDRDVRLTAIHLLGRLGRIESKPKYLEIADTRRRFAVSKRCSSAV